MTLLNLGCGPHHLDGFDNLNPPDWRFENGLPYADGEVEGISISHSLMMIPLADWPFVFSEFARVLAPGGVVRITEDDCEHHDSERRANPWHDAVTLTGPKVVRLHLKEAGLSARLQSAESTGFRDGSLLQAWHGEPPKVFFIEGRKR